MASSHCQCVQQGSENEARKSDMYSKAVRMKRGSLICTSKAVRMKRGSLICTARQ